MGINMHVLGDWLAVIGGLAFIISMIYIMARKQAKIHNRTRR